MRPKANRSKRAKQRAVLATVYEIANDGDVRALDGPAPGGATCDWGDCDRPVEFLRYDAHGHGWLGVCSICATTPLEQMRDFE